jgi:hypothetical protein
MRFLLVCLGLGIAVLPVVGCGDDPPTKSPGPLGKAGSGGAGGMGGSAAGKGGSGGMAPQLPGEGCLGFSSKLESCSLIDRPLDCTLVQEGDAELECLFDCYEAATCEAASAAYCFGAENSVDACMTACRSFACDDGTVYPTEYKCDLIPDCVGGEDEENCQTCDGGKHLPPSYVCDGFDDCADKTDEAGCPPRRTWQCDNGETVDGSYRCDGYYIDCFDGSDEDDCPVSTCPVPPAPVPGEACAKATKALVGCGLLDDGVITACADRTELLACAKECVGAGTCSDLESYFCSDVVESSDLTSCFDKCGELTNYFPCKDASTSVPASWVCDDVPDCMDESDELNCDFSCGDGMEPLPASAACDGYTDCPNGADEKGCQASCGDTGAGGAAGASGAGGASGASGADNGGGGGR